MKSGKGEREEREKSGLKINKLVTKREEDGVMGDDEGRAVMLMAGAQKCESYALCAFLIKSG